jgi:hypothetical protein
VARRIETAQITGLREQLIERTAVLLNRMYESNADLFPYRGAEIRRLKLRLHDLKTGNDILIYRFEISHRIATAPRRGPPVHTQTRLVDAC